MTKTIERITPMLLLATLGVVYGDIGTSPLYALKQCFVGYHIPVEPTAILGILSLIIWSLIFVVTYKYVFIILRADHNGEGGFLALATLCSNESKHLARKLIIALGLIGTALFYGDGVITPAISVLSALEGLVVISPHLHEYILPLSILLISLLFFIQKKGSRWIGRLFGPVMLLWFAVIAALGVPQIIQEPKIFSAFNPLFGLEFLVHWRALGFMVMGGVVLVITGAEALYADVGHFSKKAISATWLWFVFPCLLVNYLGQGALLLNNPEAISNPFYRLAPDALLPWLIVLATFATIIASQAVISGVFSLSWQAMQLGYLPRMRVLHTSSKRIGQVYVPAVNNIMFVLTLATILYFKVSDRLAAAYGIGFTAIMLVTSLMAAYLALKKWQWSIWKVGLVFVPFILLDALFFGSSLFKFMDGGWFPLLLTVLLYQIMEVWRKGTLRMHLNTLIPNASLSDYIKSISAAQTMRIPGTAVYLCAQPGVVPSALVLNLQHNKFLHEKIVFLAMLTLRSPSVADHEAIKITHLGDGISQLTVYHGYSGVPNMAEVFARASAQGLAINLEESSFFISEDRLIAAANSKLFGWREKIFIFLYRNVFNTSEHYNIPRNRIIGLGAVYKVRMF